MLRSLPEAANLDVKILATDIDPVVLDQARAGRDLCEPSSGVPAGLRRRWFEQDGAGWSPSPRPARRWSASSELNLIGDWPMRGPFDAIFCRNVAIYFDDGPRALCGAASPRCSTPGGMLYIGHSERLAGPAAAPSSNDGITTYRLTRRE